MTKIALLVPDPDYEEMWQPVAARYEALLGAELHRHVWHDPDGLEDFALILPLMAWGYQRAPDLWFAALNRWDNARLTVVNPVATLRWNSSKTYLLALESAGIPIVPTQMSSALTDQDLTAARCHFGGDDIIIKPAISGGADGTFLLTHNDLVPDSVMNRHMLIQPMMPYIVSEGEYSLFFFAGTFSHAILKMPQTGDFRVQEQFGGREQACEPPAAAMHLAQRALDAAPGPLTYARVDMVRRGGEAFCLMELELIEPSLFLEHAPDGGRAFAQAVMNGRS